MPFARQNKTLIIFDWLHIFIIHFEASTSVIFRKKTNCTLPHILLVPFSFQLLSPSGAVLQIFIFMFNAFNYGITLSAMPLAITGLSTCMLTPSFLNFWNMWLSKMREKYFKHIFFKNMVCTSEFRFLFCFHYRMNDGSAVHSQSC